VPTRREHPYGLSRRPKKCLSLGRFKFILWPLPQLGVPSRAVTGSAKSEASTTLSLVGKASLEPGSNDVSSLAYSE